MSHYLLNIPVTKEDVETIRKEFHTYLEKCGGVTLIVIPESHEPPSDELAATIRRLFVRMLLSIESGRFERMH